ncbi:Integration host factor subunit alpha [termite gut metagenome]|uniref:Integration host factor subunit alpha n=1 Tax=termite gut metagenome TaxID=433724 RepID=A0A5J4SCK5_9ZZZZ
MNNKTFIAELSKRLGYPIQETSELVNSIFADMIQHFQDGKTITIQGFGTFEVKKKTERISVNPVSKKQMLVPPKLVLAYKPSSLLKEKFK